MKYTKLKQKKALWLPGGSVNQPSGARKIETALEGLFILIFSHFFEMVRRKSEIKNFQRMRELSRQNFQKISTSTFFENAGVGNSIETMKEIEK